MREKDKNLRRRRTTRKKKLKEIEKKQRDKRK
jgi:hypothetical protein